MLLLETCSFLVMNQHLPDRFVCYLSPSAVSNLSRDDALSLAQRISKNCPLNLTHRGITRERAPSSLTTEELQVASSLVRKFEHFPPAILHALGQAAVGLSISDIENGISDKDLEASIPALGEVRGWNAEQSSTIINKLLSSGYQILDGQSLAKLGSLVAGLNSSTLRSLSPEVILEAIKLPEFVQQMVTLPSALKRTFVEKAAMFFSDVIKTEPDFSRLSQSVLQGFTCAAANEMEAERFQELAKVMKKKNVKLEEDQLSCLVKMVTLHGIPKDLDSYPKDLLLFLRQITEKVLNDDLMPIWYTPGELRACLKNVSLENHLSQILTYSFTTQQLAVLKTNLDETYPDGYPERLIPKLGPLLSFITLEDISRWKITSADTLAALLKDQPPDDQASAIIKRYIGLGNALNVTALNAIGMKYVCLLNANELNAIDSNSLKLASLNLSACSQLAKDILYAKAKRAFSDEDYLPAYYGLIEPYLGGAPGADLRDLSKDNVNMKVSTLAKLRTDSLMSLTPSEVQGLLGMNLGDLEKWQNKFPIREWVQRQKQSELDKLHVGLTGGTQEGYMNIVIPKFQSPSSAPLGTVAMTLHLLPALLISFLMMSVLS
ncbi:PREDICTED: mesothelin [Pygoscelis adeliae]|uniref:mesothelin n=1 Tax=Pygoscelis adeliae TaxID=9238 RepID=UPI0004F4DBA0|nr:PREDICTED: mesothelin [Pygoscelis adeliae]